MGVADKWYRRLRPYLVRTSTNSAGEIPMRCPLHDDENPSATINFEKGVWKCHASTSCGGGKISSLVAILDARDDGEKSVGKANYNPFEDDDNVTDLEQFKAKKENREVLNEAIVRTWHETLMKDSKRMHALFERRMISSELATRYGLGYQPSLDRYTIPVRDAEGKLVNVRKYQWNADQKIINHAGFGSPPRLFPFDQLANEELLLVEGELDALCAIDHGFAAVSGTGGALHWEAEWSRLFSGKTVFISYDNDRDGRIGAKKALKAIKPFVSFVGILPPFDPEEKADITDWFRSGAGSPAALRSIMDGIRQAKSSSILQNNVPLIRVMDSMDARTNGQSVQMQVTVIGKKNPTYSVPHKVQFSCSMDAGPKCRVCPMLDAEGERSEVIQPNEAQRLVEFIDAPKERTNDLLRRQAGIVKCSRLSINIDETQTIEELFVTGSLDRRAIEGHDFTQRRVYNVGNHATPTNITATVIGTTVPNPKDRHNEFLSWQLSEASTSIDTFVVDDETTQRLSIFQPNKGQRPIDKCFEIAEDLSANVTHIYGRQNLHVAMDLVWHSILHFNFDSKALSRGWLEFCVVGDTRTGKSETAIRLSSHYGLGHVIGCESATFAGLVGSVKQIADSWTVQWGEITTNDRRLVVLDEVSGMSRELISQLSDIRSRGIAQLTKVEIQETRARCRMIWSSNARKGRGVDESRAYGIDIIEELIGNPEDIARFDFAMSVRVDDVPAKTYNNPDRKSVPHIYTSELCHELVLWAWSRKPEHVIWKPDAFKKVFTTSEHLGRKYVGDPPLIQIANVREKLARLAVALAARTFNTDESGQNVIVLQEHVEDAASFLDMLYGSEHFGYLRLSKRSLANRVKARKSKVQAKRWLRQNPNLFNFLIDRRGSFRANDLEEMAHLDRDQVNFMLSWLSDRKLIRKDKSQIVIEDVLHEILREMEDT